MKVLIVEDDYRLAAEWQDGLLEKGYSVDKVSNADEANLILTNNYDCFIIDLFNVVDRKFHPNGGIKSIGTIRAYESRNHSKSLIITVTGHYTDGGSNRVSTDQVTHILGADHILKKPVNISKITELIEDWKYTMADED